jgi:hypothetical protein
LNDMATTINSVAYQERPRAVATFPATEQVSSVGTYQTAPDTGELTVIVNASPTGGGSYSGGTTVFEKPLGAVDIERDDATYRYKLGAVIRVGDDAADSEFVREPSISFEGGLEPTASARLVDVSNEAVLSNEVLITHNDTTQLYEDRLISKGDALVLELETELPELWAEYFRNRLGHPNPQIAISGNTVTVVLPAPEDMFVHHTHHEIDLN